MSFLDKWSHVTENDDDKEDEVLPGRHNRGFFLNRGAGPTSFGKTLTKISFRAQDDSKSNDEENAMEQDVQEENVEDNTVEEDVPIDPIEPMEVTHEISAASSEVEQQQQDLVIAQANVTSLPFTAAEIENDSCPVASPLSENCQDQHQDNEDQNLVESTPEKVKSTSEGTEEESELMQVVPRAPEKIAPTSTPVNQEIERAAVTEEEKEEKEEEEVEGIKAVGESDFDKAMDSLLEQDLALESEIEKMHPGLVDLVKMLVDVETRLLLKDDYLMLSNKLRDMMEYCQTIKQKFFKHKMEEGQDDEKEVAA